MKFSAISKVTPFAASFLWVSALTMPFAQADEVSEISKKIAELQGAVTQLQSRLSELERSPARSPTALPLSNSKVYADAAPGTVAIPTVTKAPPGQRQLKINYGPNSFEIGGIVHITYDHTSVSGGNPTTASSDDRIFGGNASRINFTFNRALSDSSSVQAFIDSSIVPTSGTGSLSGREAWLGFTGPMGQLRAGRIDTPVKQMGSYTDVFYATGIADDGQINMMGGEDRLTGFTRRQQKSLRYDSPIFGGFKFAAQYALPNENGSKTTDAPPSDSRKGQVYSTSLSYADGSFSAGLGAEVHKNLRFTSTEGLTDNGYRIGAKYIFKGIGDIGVGANYFKYEGPNDTSVTRVFSEITGNIYAGPGKIVMRYGKAGNVGGNAPDGTVICGEADVAASFSSCPGGGLQLVKGNNSGARQYVIGYDYPIDPQVSIYAYYTRLLNDDNANYNYGTNGYGSISLGSSLQGFSVGGVYVF